MLFAAALHPPPLPLTAPTVSTSADAPLSSHFRTCPRFARLGLKMITKGSFFFSFSNKMDNGASVADKITLFCFQTSIRGGPPPVFKLSIREVLELRQMKMECTPHPETSPLSESQKAEDAATPTPTPAPIFSKTTSSAERPVFLRLN